MGFWDFKILTFEILEFWDFGILGFFEILGFWDFKILGFWDLGILEIRDFVIF